MSKFFAPEMLPCTLPPSKLSLAPLNDNIKILIKQTMLTEVENNIKLYMETNNYSLSLTSDARLETFLLARLRSSC